MLRKAAWTREALESAIAYALKHISPAEALAFFTHCGFRLRPDLAQEYQQLLEAPHKEIIWFEHSGHAPWTREPARFVEVIVNKVLKQTRSPR